MLGFNKGLNNNETIKLENNSFVKKWGEDKIISNE